MQKLHLIEVLMNILRNRSFGLFVGTALAVFVVYGAWRESNGVDDVKPLFVRESRIDVAASVDRQSLQVIAYSPVTQPQLVVQLGHFAISTAFSPNGHLIATGGTDYTARLWEMEIVLVTKTLWFTNAFAQSVTKNKNQSPHLAEVKEGTSEVMGDAEIVRLAREILVVT